MMAVGAGASRAGDRRYGSVGVGSGSGAPPGVGSGTGSGVGVGVGFAPGSFAARDPDARLPATDRDHHRREAGDHRQQHPP
jgi:hypothetical protein